MTRVEFIEFIKDLGFSQVWEQNSDYFSLSTEHEPLTIHIDKESIQISKHKHKKLQITIGPVAQFELKTFGNSDDFQINLFLNFIKSSFVNIPTKILKHIRNENIKTILK